VASLVPHIVGRLTWMGQVRIDGGSYSWASGVAFGEVVGEMGGTDVVWPPVTSRGAGR